MKTGWFGGIDRCQLTLTDGKRTEKDMVLFLQGSTTEGV